MRDPSDRWWLFGMPEEPEPRSILSCSFCGQTQYEVRKLFVGPIRGLVAGPTATICVDCIETCNDVLAEEHEMKAITHPYEAIADTVRCRLCRLSKSGAEVISLDAPGFVCRSCAEAIRVALAVAAPSGAI
jgi:hypothetical protein